MNTIVFVRHTIRRTMGVQMKRLFCIGSGVTSSSTAPSKLTEQATTLDVARVDFRVGIVLKAWRHPDADSLFVEEIDFGEPTARTVVSGLVGKISLEDLIGRQALCVCNLKPSKFRGILSQAMILVAFDAASTSFALVRPPASARPGEVVHATGVPAKPDAVLNPKHKVRSTLAPFICVFGHMLLLSFTVLCACCCWISYVFCEHRFVLFDVELW